MLPAHQSRCAAPAVARRARNQRMKRPAQQVGRDRRLWGGRRGRRRVCGRPATLRTRANSFSRSPSPAQLSSALYPFVCTGRPSVDEWLLPALGSAPAAATLATALLLLPAGAAHASGGEAPPGLLDFVITFIEGLGPWGPAAFVVTVALAECIPLFPTQASGAAQSGACWRGSALQRCWLSHDCCSNELAF